jgi:hypothetical protein
MSSLVTGGDNVYFHVKGKGNASVKSIWGQPNFRVQYSKVVNVVKGENKECAQNVTPISGTYFVSLITRARCAVCVCVFVCVFVCVCVCVCVHVYVYGVGLFV